MALLQIVKYGEKVLRRQTAPVKSLNDQIERLINDMFETMYAGSGIGLAAPQVNVSLRLAVVNVTPDDKSKGIAIINPHIVKRIGRVQSEEGCLSFPGVGSVIINRAERIKVEAMDKSGLPVTIHAEGLLARCLEHEIDHLEGITLVQRSSLRKRMKLIWTIRQLKKAGLW